MKKGKVVFFKKAKVVLAQPAVGAPRPPVPRLLAPPLSRVPGPIRGGGEEAAYMASLRYRGLLQDCQELFKETKAKKRRLHMERLKKLRLLAEVKFLRKRLKSLSENPSQTIVCRGSNPAMPLTASTADWADDAEDRSVYAVGSSSRSQLVQRRPIGLPRAPPVIDLNEACEPSYEIEKEEYHGYREPLRKRDTRWKVIVLLVVRMYEFHHSGMLVIRQGKLGRGRSRGRIS